MIEVVDDYLPQKDYEVIYNYFMGFYDKGDISNSCVWAFTDGISLPQDGHYQFVQQIFFGHTIMSPAFSLLEKITEKMNAIIRIKANLITSTEKLKVFDWAFHTDLPVEKTEGVKTSIYYINDNDGYTMFEDGTKINSVANRLVTFPANLKHTGTTCTNANRRILINFNYY